MLDIADEPIDWRAKGFWSPDESLTRSEVAARGQTIFDGGFTWPLLVVRQSAVQANIATMAAYCAPTRWNSRRTPRPRWRRH